MPHLVPEVFERKAIPRECLDGDLLGFFLVHLLLGLLDERENVAHAQDSGDDAIGMKGLECIVFFTNADKLDRLTGDMADGQCGATTRIAVHFGQHDASQGQLFVKLVG